MDSISSYSSSLFQYLYSVSLTSFAVSSAFSYSLLIYPLHLRDTQRDSRIFHKEQLHNFSVHKLFLAMKSRKFSCVCDIWEIPRKFCSKTSWFSIFVERIMTTWIEDLRVWTYLSQDVNRLLWARHWTFEIHKG